MNGPDFLYVEYCTRREEKAVQCPNVSINWNVRQEMDTQDVQYKQAIRLQAGTTGRQRDVVARDLRGGHQDGCLTICP